MVCGLNGGYDASARIQKNVKQKTYTLILEVFLLFLLPSLNNQVREEVYAQITGIE